MESKRRKETVKARIWISVTGSIGISEVVIRKLLNFYVDIEYKVRSSVARKVTRSKKTNARYQIVALVTLYQISPSYARSNIIPGISILIHLSSSTVSLS